MLPARNILLICLAAMGAAASGQTPAERRAFHEHPVPLTLEQAGGQRYEPLFPAHARSGPAPLPAATPTRARIDPAALERLLDYARATATDALLVMRGGQVVEDWRSTPEAVAIEMMSATKSLVNLAVGFLIADGHLDSLDAPVAQFYPQWRDDPRRDVTVRHLLTHTSGLDGDSEVDEIHAADDVIALALRAELVAEPGSTFTYNNKAFDLLAGVVEQASGESLDDYLARRLFEPLGVRDVSWYHDDSGNPYAMLGCRIHAADLARIGMMLARGGEYGGERIVEGSWLRRSLEPVGPPCPPPFGLHWWLFDNGFYAEGYLGQMLIVAPAERLVVVRQIRRYDLGPKDAPQRRFNQRVFLDLASSLVAE